MRRLAGALLSVVLGLGGCLGPVIQFGEPVSATPENARRAVLGSPGGTGLTVCTTQGVRVLLLAAEVGADAVCGQAVNPSENYGVGPSRCIPYAQMESITEFRPRRVPYAERYTGSRQATCPLLR